jgi:hypothetical protein
MRLIEKLNTLDMMILKSIVLEYDKGNGYTNSKEIIANLKKNIHYINKKVDYRTVMMRLQHLASLKLIFIKNSKPYMVYLYDAKKSQIRNFVNTYFDLLNIMEDVL